MKHALPLLLLMVLCAGLLALFQHLALPRIEQQRQAAAERALLDLLSPGSYDNHPLQQPIALSAGGLLGNRRAASAYLARLHGQPSALLLPVTSQGYEGPIHLLVAISPDGHLLASKVLQQQETPGLADLLSDARHLWLATFDGKDLNSEWTLRTDGGTIDQIAGATITSHAVSDALQRALRFFDAERQRLLAGQP